MGSHQVQGNNIGTKISIETKPEQHIEIRDIHIDRKTHFCSQKHIKVIFHHTYSITHVVTIVKQNSRINLFQASQTDMDKLVILSLLLVGVVMIEARGLRSRTRKPKHGPAGPIDEFTGEMLLLVRCYYWIDISVCG